MVFRVDSGIDGVNFERKRWNIFKTIRYALLSVFVSLGAPMTVRHCHDTVGHQCIKCRVLGTSL